MLFFEKNVVENATTLDEPNWKLVLIFFSFVTLPWFALAFIRCCQNIRNDIHDTDSDDDDDDINLYRYQSRA